LTALELVRQEELDYDIDLLSGSSAFSAPMNGRTLFSATSCSKGLGNQYTVSLQTR